MLVFTSHGAVVFWVTLLGHSALSFHLGFDELETWRCRLVEEAGVLLVRVVLER